MGRLVAHSPLSLHFSARSGCWLSLRVELVFHYLRVLAPGAPQVLATATLLAIRPLPFGEMARPLLYRRVCVSHRPWKQGCHIADKVRAESSTTLERVPFWSAACLRGPSLPPSGAQGGGFGRAGPRGDLRLHEAFLRGDLHLAGDVRRHLARQCGSGVVRGHGLRRRLAQSALRQD